MVFEAHSTDYQLPDALRALVQDHFAILKVGPGATFVLREALWALDQIETEWLGTARSSRLRETTLAAMREDPIHWRKYHEADDPRLDLQLQYSLSDRIRYYWPVEKVQAAVTRLFTSLDADPPPLALVSQYLPASGQAIREGRITARAREMVIHHVTTLLASYAAACGLNVKQRHAHS
jgi:D-tagatose-1,6-bisphosphate aldolase subunit GatZ/KbaZ